MWPQIKSFKETTAVPAAIMQKLKKELVQAMGQLEMNDPFDPIIPSYPGSWYVMYKPDLHWIVTGKGNVGPFTPIALQETLRSIIHARHLSLDIDQFEIGYTIKK